MLVPDPVTTEALRVHRRSQDDERRQARNLWHDLDFVFARDDGKPMAPRKDSMQADLLGGRGWAMTSPHGQV